MEPLRMYIVVRKDLLKSMGWSLGAVIAQAAHASTAVLHLNNEHPNTQAYLKDLHSMHKVVLETKNQTSLDQLAEALDASSFKYVKWIEQPENIATCIATVPYSPQEIKHLFKKCQLLKN